MKKWLDKYQDGGQAGYTDIPFKYNSAWGGQFQDGGEKSSRLEELGSDAYTAMAPFYNTLFEAANKYADKETGLVSPFNSFRAATKAMIKHPEVLFMKRHHLPNKTENPYGVEPYTMDKAFGPDKIWWPTDWAEPRKEHHGIGEKIGEWLQERRDRREQRRDERFQRKSQTPKGMLNMMRCFGANCYESETPTAAMGASIPGSVGFTYARTGGIPSNGPYAKKTKASAQDGISFFNPPPSGNFTFLEPTSSKLPSSYVIPYRTPSSELASSIGGEDGEPAFLIPTFKYGQPLEDPDLEFKKTKEHLGGPFKTWQEADEWDRTIRHPYVEKGQDIPTPLRRWGKDFENGGSMSYYQHGLDWKPKTISDNGSMIPQAQTGDELRQWAKENKIPYGTATSEPKRDRNKEIAKAVQSAVKKGQVTDVQAGTKATTKKLIEKSKENYKKDEKDFKRLAAQNKKEKEERIAERKAAKNFNEGKSKTFTFPTGETKSLDQMDWRDKAYIAGKSLEGKGRFFEDEESFIDEWVNPLNLIGGMAGGLATAPYEAKQSDSYLPYFTSVGAPVVVGMLGFDPLGSAIKAAEHPLVSTIPSVIKHGAYGPYGEALFFGAANKVAPLVANTPGLNLAYKKAAEKIGEQSAGAFRNLSDIKNIFKKVSQPYKGRMSNLGERNLLRNYIYGDTRGFVTSDIPTTGLEKYTNKYGPLKKYKLDTSEIGNNPINIEELNSHYANLKLKDKGIFKEGMSTDEKYQALKNHLKDVEDIQFGTDSYTFGNDDIGGHMRFLRYDPATDNIMMKTQDLWKFAPEDYIKRYSINSSYRNFTNPVSLSTYLKGYSKSKQAALMEKAGKPFVLIDERPIVTKLPDGIKKINIDKSKLTLSPELLKQLEEIKNLSDVEYKEFISKQGLINRKKGGVIKDDRGQWAHPGEVTEIGSNRITMKDVPYPVLGISDQGDTQIMFPEQEYKFKGKKVTEIPMAQKGKELPPIETDDPRKVQAYKDSLALYNWRFQFPERKDSYGIQYYNTNRNRKDYVQSLNEMPLYIPGTKKQVNSLLNKINRTGNLPIGRERIEAELPVFKKPVQPYILKEKPKVDRKELSRPAEKISKDLPTPSLPELNLSEKQPLQGEYEVSYFDPTQEGGLQGGWQTKPFMTSELADRFMEERVKAGMHGPSMERRKITQKVNQKSTGGWLNKYK